MKDGNLRGPLSFSKQQLATTIWRERERDTEREKEREKEMCVCVCLCCIYEREKGRER